MEPGYDKDNLGLFNHCCSQPVSWLYHFRLQVEGHMMEHSSNGNKFRPHSFLGDMS